jgi:hypothetical protein
MTIVAVRFVALATYYGAIGSFFTRNYSLPALLILALWNVLGAKAFFKDMDEEVANQYVGWNLLYGILMGSAVAQGTGIGTLVDTSFGTHPKMMEDDERRWKFPAFALTVLFIVLAMYGLSSRFSQINSVSSALYLEDDVWAWVFFILATFVALACYVLYVGQEQNDERTYSTLFYSMLLIVWAVGPAFPFVYLEHPYAAFGVAAGIILVGSVAMGYYAVNYEEIGDVRLGTHQGYVAARVGSLLLMTALIFLIGAAAEDDTEMQTQQEQGLRVTEWMTILTCAITGVAALAYFGFFYSSTEYDKTTKTMANVKNTLLNASQQYKASILPSHGDGLRRRKAGQRV